MFLFFLQLVAFPFPPLKQRSLTINIRTETKKKEKLSILFILRFIVAKFWWC